MKKTYIAAYELLAEVCAYNSFPEQLRGRIVHHFVDNTAALAGSKSGYSGKPDCARLIDALVVRILRLACRPWFGFVYSEDNLSDLPSREEFGLLQKLNSTRRVLVRPSPGTLGCDEPNVEGLGKPDVPVCKPGQYWCTSPSRATSFSAREKAFLRAFFCQSGTVRIPCLRSLCTYNFLKSVHF